VASDEILRRLDAHLERIDTHMERGNEIMERSNELIESNREFMQQITLRQERFTERVIRHLDDLTEEIRAQRGALLRILDRLDNGGATSSA
jgi:hypothetical protein